LQFLEHWLIDERVLHSLAQALFVNGTRVEGNGASGNDKHKSRLIKDGIRYMKALTLSDHARMSALEVELFSTVPNEINCSPHDEFTSPGKRLKVFLEKKRVPPEAVLHLLQQNAEGYPMSHYRNVLADILAARLFLSFQALPNDAPRDANDEDPMQQLVLYQSLGQDFRRRFALPRPPWRVHRDLEEFCGGSEFFSLVPLIQIYELDR
jgi:hypothetical protein